jgi:serine/threonine protein phosphatase PrpC
MSLEFRWWSQIGSRTDDNRDFGAIGLRGDEALCAILDGASSGRDSGALARRIAMEIIDWYVEREAPPDPEAIIERLRALHAELFTAYPQASASYLFVLLRTSGEAVALHVGDCLLGRLEEGHVVWLCQPHTLANALIERPIAEIALQPSRHRVIRSFRRREFMAPDVVDAIEGALLIMATDGFWADCSAVDQARYLQADELDDTEMRDDRSYLQVRRVPEECGAQLPETSKTLYVRSRAPAK